MEKEGKVHDVPKIGGPEGIGEDITILKQIIDSMDESEKKLEEFYKKDDPENFSRLKKFMVALSGKISEIIK